MRGYIITITDTRTGEIGYYVGRNLLASPNLTSSKIYSVHSVATRARPFSVKKKWPGMYDYLEAKIHTVEINIVH